MSNTAAKAPIARRPMPGRRPVAQPRTQPASQPAVEVVAPAPSVVAPIVERAPVHSAPAPLPANVDFESIENTMMFVSLAAIRAQAAAGRDVRRDERTIREARRMPKRELFAIAEIAYHYVRCGGFRLAAVIFDGLAAIDPDEPYFALGMGLVSDRLDDRDAAIRWYERARRLDPTDGRADLNLAELLLGSRHHARALQLLETSAHKAATRGDDDVARAAAALSQLATRTR